MLSRMSRLHFRLGDCRGLARQSPGACFDETKRGLEAVETRGVGFEWEFYARKANSGLLY